MTHLHAVAGHAELHELQARAYRRDQDDPHPRLRLRWPSATHARKQRAPRQAAIGQEHLVIALAEAPDSLAARTLDAVGAARETR